MPRKKKPPANEFIIAAIRKLRPRPANLKSGTASGIRLQRVYQVALGAYTDEEFRRGLRLVIEQSEVIVYAQVTVHRGMNYRKTGSEIISVISDDVPLDKRKWCLNVEGHPLNREMEQEYREIWSIRICVRADGLPLKVRKILTPQAKKSNKSLAEEIIDSMQ